MRLRSPPSQTAEPPDHNVTGILLLFFFRYRNDLKLKFQLGQNQKCVICNLATTLQCVFLLIVGNRTAKWR